MSRTSRMFLLMDALRAHRRPVTAAHLANELAVSVRTIYRDVQTLIELGAPVDGEAGLGYVLRAGFFLPPLMFAEDEIEALVLGARWVKQQGDEGLAHAAAAALAKIATATPKDLRDKMAESSLWVTSRESESVKEAALGFIRAAIRYEHKLMIDYADESGARTQRVIWPFALAFFERKRVVAGWCELRNGFRHFRTDRIAISTPIAECYPRRRSALLKAWRLEMKIPVDS
jgi:predicted DNA-binding transcriptional regulator YafY